MFWKFNDGLSKNCGAARCPGTVASQVLLEIWLPWLCKHQTSRMLNLESLMGILRHKFFPVKIPIHNISQMCFRRKWRWFGFASITCSLHNVFVKPVLNSGRHHSTKIQVREQMQRKSAWQPHQHSKDHFHGLGGDEKLDRYGCKPTTKLRSNCGVALWCLVFPFGSLHRIGNPPRTIHNHRSNREGKRPRFTKSSGWSSMATNICYLRAPLWRYSWKQVMLDVFVFGHRFASREKPNSLDLFEISYKVIYLPLKSFEPRMDMAEREWRDADKDFVFANLKFKDLKWEKIYRIRRSFSPKVQTKERKADGNGFPQCCKNDFKIYWKFLRQILGNKRSHNIWCKKWLASNPISKEKEEHRNQAPNIAKNLRDGQTSVHGAQKANKTYWDKMKTAFKRCPKLAYLNPASSDRAGVLTLIHWNDSQKSACQVGKAIHHATKKYSNSIVAELLL